ncbi:MAG TPA: hypothetical protein PKA64_16700 [Myxococcota bacterium]|nr:hypothetical protein [Myxococcota bacterium]
MSRIKRVTVLRQLGTPQATSTSLSPEGKRTKRKTSRWLRPAEKMRRRLLQSQERFAEVLLEEHEKSSRKKRNGWLRDGNKAWWKATRKAAKRLWRI